MFQKRSTKQFEPLANADDLAQAVKRSDQHAVVLFKHSMTCSLSARAYREMQKLTEENDPEVFMLTVQEHRNLSDQMETNFGIRHESPQIFVLVDGNILHHSSHTRVTASSVRDVLGIHT